MKFRGSGGFGGLKVCEGFGGVVFGVLGVWGFGSFGFWVVLLRVAYT